MDLPFFMVPASGRETAFFGIKMQKIPGFAIITGSCGGYDSRTESR